MNRRHLLLAGGTIVLAGAGVGWQRSRRPSPALGPLIEHLGELQTRPLASTGAWSVFRIFSHLAQSIDYSIGGYPELRPAWFRATLGPTAFFGFETADAMRHGLDEPIPGAPMVALDGDAATALSALIDTLQKFESYDGPLQPHFAYGVLSKQQYLAAHSMHVRNHLSEIAWA